MTADTPSLTDTQEQRRTHGWRWAPAWVLTFVALWPAPGYAEAVMVLGALAAIVRLLLDRFRGGTRLLSGAAWALTSALFAAYWLPQVVSAVDAVDAPRALRQDTRDGRVLDDDGGARGKGLGRQGCGHGFTPGERRAPAKWPDRRGGGRCRPE